MSPLSDHHGRYLPLVWRLFLSSATVLVAACVLLIANPPNGRVAVIGGGLVVLLAVNLALMHHAFAPLRRLTELTARVDPLRPGERLPLQGPATEVQILTASFNDMLGRIEEERRDSARRALTAEQDQRRGIAHELHDELGQELTALRLQAALLVVGVDGQQAGPVDAITAGIDDALESLRRISRSLRPEALDDLGLVAALTHLCRRMSDDFPLHVSARIDRDLPSMSPEAELVVYRVAQESLTNVVRHADASSAALELAPRGGGLVLEVRDDGVGVDPGRLAAGSGVRGMRERALLMGGSLDIERRNGQGTAVVLRLPPEIA